MSASPAPVGALVQDRPVPTLFINPAGTMLFTLARQSKAVCVIDVDTRTVKAIMGASDTSEPIDLAFTGDGQRMYVLGRQGDITVVDVASLRALTTFQDAELPFHIAVDPANGDLFLLNSNATVSIINPQRFEIKAHVSVGQSPQAIAASPRGGSFYVVRDTATLHSEFVTVDAKTASVVTRLPVCNTSNAVIVWPAGNQALVTCNDEAITAVDLSSMTVLREVSTLRPGSERTGLFDALAQLASGGRIHILDADRFPELRRLGGLAIGPLAFSRDGRTMFWLTQDQLLFRPTVVRSEYTVLRTISAGAGPNHVALSRDGHTLYICNYDTNTVDFIDVHTGRRAGSVAVGRAPFAIAVSPDGSTVNVADVVSNDVTMIDVASRVGRTIPAGTSPVALAAADNTLYVANLEDNSVSVIDPRRGRSVATIAVGKSPDALALDASGGVLYVANAVGNSVSVVDARLHKVIGTIAVPRDPVALAFDGSHDALYVLCNERPAVIVKIDGKSKRIRATQQIDYYPRDLAITQDGRRIFVTYDLSTASVLDEELKEIDRINDAAGFGIAADPRLNVVYVAHVEGANITVIGPPPER